MFAAQGTIVKLTLNEPLNAYQTLRGKLVRPIKSLDEKSLYYLFQDENGNSLVIKPRYEGDQVEEVHMGKQIQVAIASIIDENVLYSSHFRSNQVNYFGIGTITRTGDQ